MKVNDAASSATGRACPPQCLLYAQRASFCTTCAACPLPAECLADPPGAAWQGGTAAPQVLSESSGQSPEGGHIRTRILRDPGTGAVVEDIELHCRPLTFHFIKQRGQLVPLARGQRRR